MLIIDLAFIAGPARWLPSLKRKGQASGDETKERNSRSTAWKPMDSEEG